MSFLRLFLVRRRFDKWALGLASISLPLKIGIGPIILLCFSCIGIYLAVARHNTTRLFAKNFYIFILLYAAWSLGWILIRGEPFHDNRQIGYTLLLTIFAFAPCGMVLIADPLRFFVLGARVGTIITACVAVVAAIIAGGRIGIGGNAAVFAFVTGITAIAATIPLRHPHRILRNGPHWLVLGIASVLTSETRAVIVALPVFAAVEIIAYLRRYTLRQQGFAYAALFTALAAVVIVGPVGGMLSKRFSGMVEYYDSGDSSRWEDKESADIRKVMWQSAVKVIEEHPINGVGSYNKMNFVRAEAKEQAPLLEGFLHVHNAILDELLNDGFVGLFFLLAAFLSASVYIWRTADSAGMRRALIYFILICGSYGMLHNPLLHEVTISAIMMFIAVLLAAASRRIMAAKRADLSLRSGKRLRAT